MVIGCSEHPFDDYAICRFHPAFHAGVEPRRVLAAEVDVTVVLVDLVGESAHLAGRRRGPGVADITLLFHEQTLIGVSAWLALGRIRRRIAAFR